MSAKILAKYPGRCICGAAFKAGSAIYWDASIRRATGCPACAAPRARAGEPRRLSGGLVVRFDTHPQTGEVLLCRVADPTEANAVEVYQLVGGQWRPRLQGGRPVLTRPPTHSQIESWRLADLPPA